MTFTFDSEASVLENKQTQEQSAVERLCANLARKDFAYLSPDKTRALLEDVNPNALADWDAFSDSWSQLATDEYMADGGSYRKRRHATLSALPASRLVTIEAHQPHYQSLSYNTLNGGVARHYEPIDRQILTGSTMSSVIKLGCELFGRLSPYYPWHIEVHQFRIEAGANAPGKPTPEGVHRDGVNFVIMMMVKRTNLVSGSTKIFDLDKTRLDEFTLQEPLEMAIVNDERVFHGVTPIVQLDQDKPATRDVLVVTFRRKF